MASSRRAVLAWGLVIVAGYTAVRYGAPAVSDLFAGEFEFEPVANPAGFRRLTAGQSSSGFDRLFGLDGKPDAQMQDIVAEVETRICRTLYGDTTWSDTVLPLASFSDYNCPFCRVLTQRLAKMEDASDGQLRINWHELPLLGEASLMAAKGALAAKRQGAYVAFHKRLMRTPFQTTPKFIEGLAEDLGIDKSRLIEDMNSEAVLRELQESSALSKVFGFIGTPALVVGRTVVEGEINERTLARLIERERADGPLETCA